MSLAKRSQSSLSRHSPPTRCCPECSKMPPILFLLQAGEISPSVFSRSKKLPRSVAGAYCTQEQSATAAAQRAQLERESSAPSPAKYSPDRQSRSARPSEAKQAAPSDATHRSLPAPAPLPARSRRERSERQLP